MTLSQQPIVPCMSTLTFVLRLVDAELPLGHPAHKKLSFNPETDTEEDVRGDLQRSTCRRLANKLH